MVNVRLEIIIRFNNLRIQALGFKSYNLFWWDRSSTSNILGNEAIGKAQTRSLANENKKERDGEKLINGHSSDDML